MSVSTTYNTAVDEVLARFKAAWDTTGYPVVYPNSALNAEPPVTDVAWARINIQHIVSGQSAFGGTTNKYLREALLTVQIFVLSGKGLPLIGTLVKLMQDTFEGTTTDSGIWFRNAVPNEIGPSGKWFQTNFLVEFSYNEVK